MHHSPVITIKRITRIVTSAGVLYFAKSGVNTPMSSPPLDMVTADTKRNDKCSVFKNCFFFIGASCNSNNLLIPRIIGINPIKPITNKGTAKVRNAANDEIITRTSIPRNCPRIILCTNRPGVENNNIRIKVSSMLEATKAVVPVARRLAKSVNLQSYVNLVNLIVT